MRKITSYFAIMSLSLSSVYADISIAQVDTYLEVSGGQAVLETLQTQLSDAIDAKIRNAGKPVNQNSINTIKEILTSDSNIDLYKSDIQHLNIETYQAILDFYHTEIGKKCADIAKSMDMITIEQEVANFIKTQRENPFSIKKIALIQAITQAVKTLDMQVSISKKMFGIMNESLPKKIQMSEEQIEMMLQQLTPIIEQQAMISINYTFKDYTESELEEVLAYSKSKAGKEEALVVMHGTIKYVEVTMAQIMHAFIEEKKHAVPDVLSKAS